MKYTTLIVAIFTMFALLPVGSGAQDNEGTQTCYEMVPDTQDRTDLWCIVIGATYTPEVAELPTNTPLPIPTNTLQPTLQPTATVANTRPTMTMMPTPIAQATKTPKPGAVTREVLAGQSIQAALNVANVGDIVRVHAGTYKEQLTINKSIVLARFGDGPAIIDGGCNATTNYYGVLINGDDVSVLGMTIQNVMTGIQLNGDFRQPARGILENNTILNYNCNGTGQELNAGIAAYYSGPNQRIVNNRIERRPAGTTGPVAGPGDGIWFKSATGAGRQSGGGHYISGNTIIGGWDGIGTEVEADVHGGFDRNTYIGNNTISNCGDDGIQVEGGAENVVVDGNTIKECGLGVGFAPNLTGPLYIQRNTITSSTFGTLGALACMKVGNDSPATAIVDSNTCNMGPGGKGIEQTNSGMGVLITNNNTFNVNSYVFEFSGLPAAGSMLDYDCMHSTDPTRLAKWGGVIYTPAQLSAFQAASGQEQHARVTC
jgi:hypothetical protein